MSRKETTLRLRRVATYYFVDKGFSVYDEVGLKASKHRSNLRADILAFNMKGDLIITEIKSSWRDFVTDTKWESYLEYCNKMYFLITIELFESKQGEYIKKRAKEHGAGILVVDSEGGVRALVNAKRRKVPGKTRRWLLTKLAWRGGFSKATIDRSMRFDCSTKSTPMQDLSLIQFLGLCKADRSSYLSKHQRCGYKRYLAYPLLNSDPYS